MVESKYWCFTCNNYESVPLGLPPRGTYAVLGKEVAPTTGTPHLQGYVEFSCNQRPSAIKKWLGQEAHCSKRIATAKQAADYCKKEGDYAEYGAISPPPRPGTRSDIHALVKDAVAGTRLRVLLKNHPVAYARYSKAVDRIQMIMRDSSWRDVRVYVYFGPTRVGKTRAALALCPEEDTYVCPSTPKGSLWFDGYEGQTFAILDDFHGQYPLVELLRVLDGTPCLVPIKGGFVQWRPEVIFITSNIHPLAWYDYSSRLASRDALMARICDVVDFTPPPTQEGCFVCRNMTFGSCACGRVARPTQ